MKRSIGNISFFALIFLIADQMIKIIISNRMILGQNTVLIPKLLSLNLVHNEGAAFSIFTGSRWLLILIGVVVALGILLYAYKGGITTDLELFIYSLLLGGILGNLVDRIVHGYVIDYLSFSVGGFYLPIFNFADICIVLSIVFLFAATLKGDLWK